MRAQRQLDTLSPGEVSDLAESLVRHLSTELEQLGVAGAGQVEKWELAERIRAAVYEHHREVRARAAGPF